MWQRTWERKIEAQFLFCTEFRRETTIRYYEGLVFNDVLWRFGVFWYGVGYNNVCLVAYHAKMYGWMTMAYLECKQCILLVYTTVNIDVQTWIHNYICLKRPRRSPISSKDSSFKRWREMLLRCDPVRWISGNMGRPQLRRLLSHGARAAVWCSRDPRNRELLCSHSIRWRLGKNSTALIMDFFQMKASQRKGGPLWCFVSNKDWYCDMETMHQIHFKMYLIGWNMIWNLLKQVTVRSEGLYQAPY